MDVGMILNLVNKGLGEAIKLDHDIKKAKKSNANFMDILTIATLDISQSAALGTVIRLEEAKDAKVAMPAKPVVAKK